MSAVGSWKLALSQALKQSFAADLVQPAGWLP